MSYDYYPYKSYRHLKKIANGEAELTLDVKSAIVFDHQYKNFRNEIALIQMMEDVIYTRYSYFRFSCNLRQNKPKIFFSYKTESKQSFALQYDLESLVKYILNRCYNNFQFEYIFGVDIRDILSIYNEHLIWQIKKMDKNFNTKKYKVKFKDSGYTSTVCRQLSSTLIKYIQIYGKQGN